MAARQMVTLDQRLEHIAAALDTDVDLIPAGGRELAQYDLELTDFPLVRPIPSTIDTDKLAALGWDSTPHADAVSRTIDEHLGSDRTGGHHGPARKNERHAIERLTT